MSQGRGRIAVVGAGAAGLTAAYLLQRRHDVVLFEAADRMGGHVNTVVLDQGVDRCTPIDTGFIVYNERNYPLFSRLLDQLEVRTRTSEMSFSYHCESSGLQYSGSGFNGLFAQRANLADPRFWRLVAGIGLFCSAARAQLGARSLGRESFGQFLARCPFGTEVAANYALPMAAAIWSASRDDIRAFPAASVLSFFDNHGLLDFRDRPAWRTIAGGSHIYVRRLLDRFAGEVRCGMAVHGIRRSESSVSLRLPGDVWETFDHVVVATHADQTLRMLEDSSVDEDRYLGPWRYSASDAVLHTDATFMPPNPRAWAAWNYRRPDGHGEAAPVSVTYHMNALQGLKTKHEYFVTLNPTVMPPDEHVIGTYRYSHPCYEQAALDTQDGLRGLNRRGRTHFCGSYMGHGFHEDAVRSAVDVAAQFGVEL